MFNYSIIIPHYNSHDLLVKCVNSIPKRDDIQIIVVDDNSPHKPDVKDFWTDIEKRATVILLKENRTAGGARNEALKVAQGKWVVFADADDYFEPAAFDVFDKYKDSEYDIVYFKTISRFADTFESSDRHLYYNELIVAFNADNSDSCNRLRFHFGPPWGKMVSRKLISDNKIWFDEVRYSNDVMFSTKIGYYANKIFADTETVYCITVSHGSLVNTQNLNSLRQRYIIALNQNLFLRERGFKEYEKPIMNYVRRSAKYGIKTFFEFVKIGKRNKARFFNGCEKWVGNMIREVFHRNDKKKYIVN